MVSSGADVAPSASIRISTNCSKDSRPPRPTRWRYLVDGPSWLPNSAAHRLAQHPGRGPSIDTSRADFSKFQELAALNGTTWRSSFLPSRLLGAREPVEKLKRDRREAHCCSQTDSTNSSSPALVSACSPKIAPGPPGSARVNLGPLAVSRSPCGS